MTIVKSELQKDFFVLSLLFRPTIDFWVRLDIFTECNANLPLWLLLSRVLPFIIEVKHLTILPNGLFMFLILFEFRLVLFTIRVATDLSICAFVTRFKYVAAHSSSTYCHDCGGRVRYFMQFGFISQSKQLPFLFVHLTVLNSDNSFGLS